MENRTLSQDTQYIALNYPEYFREVAKNFRWNYSLFILEASTFTVSLAMFSQETTLPYLISKLTNRSIWIGVIPAIFYLGLYIPQIMGAFLVHARPTRKWVLFWIAIVQRVVTLFLALVVQALNILPNSTILILFLVSYTLFSMTNGMIRPPYADLINKTIIHSRGMFYGMLTGITGVIGFLSSLLASHLLDHYPFPLNFQAMFWIAFAVTLISPLIIAAFRENPFPEPNLPETLWSYFRAIPSTLKKHPNYVRYLMSRSLIGIAFMATSFYAVYSVREFNLDPGMIGVYTMLALMSRSITGFIWGWVGDKFGYKLIMLGIALSLGMQAFLALLSPSTLTFILIVLLIGIINSAVWIGDPNMIFEIAPPAETGKFIGMTNTIIGPIMVIAPLIGGGLADAFSYQTLFWLCALISVIAFFYTLVVVEEPRKGTALVDA